MLRRIAARLGVPPGRCVLVEDTLEHQRAAHALGMRTVWMQRYLEGRFRGTLRSGGNAGSQAARIGRHALSEARATCMPKSARFASSLLR